MFGENINADETDEDEGSISINDFCFIENYFIETRQQINVVGKKKENHLWSNNSIYFDESKFSHGEFCLDY